LKIRQRYWIYLQREFHFILFYRQAQELAERKTVQLDTLAVSSGFLYFSFSQSNN